MIVRVAAKRTRISSCCSLVFASILSVILLASTTGMSALAAGHVEQAPPPFAAKLQPLLAAKLKMLRIPGAIIYIDYPGQGTWATTMGTSDLTSQAPMNLNDHVRVGSITKTMTATVILQLAQEGKLSLNDPVSKYQSEVPNGNNITIREMLQMTSGLYNYSEDKAFNQKLDSDPQKVWNQKDLLTIAFQHQPYFPPGKGYHYSNTNYILLGMIIEQLTHQPVATTFQQRIFNPLGMHNTSLPAITSAAIPDPHPRGYMFGTNVESLTQPVLSGEQAAKADAAAGKPNDVTNMNPSWAWTAGSAISDLNDMRIWAKALATGQLLNASMHKEQLQGVATSSAPGAPQYGLGIVNFNGVLGHDGTLPGYQSFEGYNLQKQATIIVLTNLFLAPDGTMPANELTMVILKELAL
jgi:D-alanyl-D-alanine carboxypeptidase